MKFFYLVFLILVSCDNSPQSEDYGLSVPADIALTFQNHPHGWAKAQCFYCHVKTNIHLVDRTGSGLIEIARSQVNQSGIQSCSGCHGSNGL